MSPRPRVLATTSQQFRERPLRRTDLLTGRNYADALTQVGLLPLFSASLPPELADEALHGIDGVLFTGGVDPDPRRFQQPPHPGLGTVDVERDAFELALYSAARNRGLPILGVCRGIQLVTIAEGGDMHQDLAARPGTHQHEQRHRAGDPIHEIRIEPGSKLAEAFGSERAFVNSYHHQAVDRTPDRLRVVARSDDGVVEAIEATGGTFLLAVQWHPEMAFVRHPEQIAPFAAFASALGA